MSELAEDREAAAENDISIARLVASDLGTVAFLGASSSVIGLQIIKDRLYEVVPDMAYRMQPVIDRWSLASLCIATTGALTYLLAHSHFRSFEDENGQRHRELIVQPADRVPENP